MAPCSTWRKSAGHLPSSTSCVSTYHSARSNREREEYKKRQDAALPRGEQRRAVLVHVERREAARRSVVCVTSLEKENGSGERCWPTAPRSPAPESRSLGEPRRRRRRRGVDGDRARPFELEIVSMPRDSSTTNLSRSTRTVVSRVLARSQRAEQRRTLDSVLRVRGPHKPRSKYLVGPPQPGLNHPVNIQRSSKTPRPRDRDGRPWSRRWLRGGGAHLPPLDGRAICVFVSRQYLGRPGSDSDDW